MDGSNADVVVIGRNCVDYIAVVDRLPDEDQKAPLAFRLVEGGGQGGTAACCIARLGGRASLVGKVGGDEEGAFCLDRLRAFGVDTHLVEAVAGGTTPVAYLFVTRGSGRRTIVYEPSRLPKIEMDERHKALLSNSKVVLLDPETTYLAEYIRQEADPHIRIVYDCERWKTGVKKAMSIADYFIPASIFLDSDALGFGRVEFHKKVLMLDELVKGQLIVTHGRAGAFYPYRGRLHRVPAPDVEAIDTTGAGDNFHGAFSFAVSRDFDVHRAVKFAVAVASLSCRGYGGRKGLPDFQEALGVAEGLDVKKA